MNPLSTLVANTANHTVTFPSLAGGIASEMTGGNFWEGFANGLIVSALNHAMHRTGPGDPPVLRNTRDYVYLKFNGNTLSVVTYRNNKTIYETPATSGKGEGMNNPAAQNIENIGPIPEGMYSFNNNNWNTLTRWQQFKRWMAGGDWGTHNVPLDIVHNDQPHRSGFYLHGGFIKGSAGCIDAGANISIIYELTKQQSRTNVRVNY